MAGLQEKRNEQEIMKESSGTQGIQGTQETQKIQGKQGTQGTHGTHGQKGMQGQKKIQECSQFHELFQQHKIIPDIVSQEPQYLLEVKFNGVSKSPGDEIHINDLKKKPDLKWMCENNKYYTLMMLKCGQSDKEAHQQKYWCVLNIQGDNIDQGFEDIAYQTPPLSNDNEEARLAFFVFEQRDKEQVDENDKKQPGINVNLKEIVNKKNLQLVGCNFFILRP